MLQEIIPSVPSQERLQWLIRAQFQVIRVEWEARQPKWEPENVVFRHDPEWKNRFWSIQSAHDCNHLGWGIVRVAWVAATVGPYLVRMI